MNVKVTIELEVTPSNEAGFNNLLGQLSALAVGNDTATGTREPGPEEPMDPMPESPGDEAPQEPEPTPAPKRVRTRTKKAPEPSPAPSPEPEPEPEPLPDPNLNPVESEARGGKEPLPSYSKLPEKQPKPKYTIDWVRRLLAEKVSKYRAECKQKLADLGAANVSSLDPEKYAEFVDFLNTLNV